MLSAFLASFAALIPITNPFGAIAAYAGLSAGLSPAQVRRQAWRTGVYVGAILVVFAVVGTLLLTFLGISLSALQIAGGLVVMHSGFQMLSSKPQLSKAESQGLSGQTDVSFSPMALPLIAGPGAIGVVIGLSARNPHLLDRVGVVIAAVAIGALTAFVLRFGTPLVDRLGPTGIGALTRVMGFLILAIGVEIGLHGVLTVVQARS